MDGPSSGPDSLTKLALDAKRKKRRAVIVLIAIPVVVGVVGLLLTRASDANKKAALDKTWTDAVGCVFGGELGENERASLKFRAIQLGNVHADGPMDTRWPNRCADSVAELNQTLRSNGHDENNKEGLTYRSEQLALALRKNQSALTDMSVEIDSFYAAAEAMNVEPGDYNGDKPPTALAAWTLDTLPKEAQISPLALTTESVYGEALPGIELHILVHDLRVKSPPILCTFARERATCRKLQGALAELSTLRLEGTTAKGASPLISAGQRGSDGIFRSDTGARVDALVAVSSSIAADGRVALTTGPLDNDGRFELIQQGLGAELSRLVIKPELFEPEANHILNAAVMWDTLFVRYDYVPDEKEVAEAAEAVPAPKVDKDADKRAMVPHFAYAKLPLTEGETLAKAFTVVGAVGSPNAALSGCRSEAGTILAVGDYGGFLLFEKDGVFRNPLAVGMFGGQATCNDGLAVFTHGYRVQNRCTPSGCEQRHGTEPKYAPYSPRSSGLAALGGKLLSVATVKEAGVRYRFADAKLLDQVGGDQLLFDDHVKDHAVVKASTVNGIKLFSRGDFAVLLVSTPAGMYAFRVSSDGAPKPISIDWVP